MVYFSTYASEHKERFCAPYTEINWVSIRKKYPFLLFVLQARSRICRNKEGAETEIKVHFIHQLLFYLNFHYNAPIFTNTHEAPNKGHILWEKSIFSGLCPAGGMECGDRTLLLFLTSSAHTSCISFLFSVCFYSQSVLFLLVDDPAFASK